MTTDYEKILSCDRERVLRVMQGEQDAFADLVETYQRSVYNLCYRMLGTAAEAEDAAQETFIRAYQHLEHYDTGRSFKTWLLSIASHYCIDVIRKRRLTFLSLEDLLPAQLLHTLDACTMDDLMIHHQRDAAIQDMLAKLNPQERAIIILRYWYDMSYEEIAEILDANIGVVKSRLFRARQALVNSIRVHHPVSLSPAL